MSIKQIMTCGFGRTGKSSERRGNALVQAVLLGALLCAGAVMASGGGGGMPWESPLTTLKESLTGPVAFVISILAIVGAGAGLIFGGGEMSAFVKTVLYIVIVIALIMGASAFMNNMGWSSAVLPQTITPEQAAAIQVLVR